MYNWISFKVSQVIDPAFLGRAGAISMDELTRDYDVPAPVKLARWLATLWRRVPSRPSATRGPALRRRDGHGALCRDAGG